MTPDSGEDPADGSGSTLPVPAGPPADGDGELVVATGSGLTADWKAKRSQKRALKKEIKESLGDWSFFQGRDPGAPIRFVIEGDRIGKQSGDAESIGQVIVRLSRLFSALGGRPQLEGLVFGNSVTVEFRPLKSEIKRATESLEAAQRIADVAGDNPTPAQEAEMKLALGNALTDMVVAAELASTLITARSQDAPEVAVSLGGEVAGAYKTLANAIVREGVTLKVETLDQEPAELTPTRAKRVVEELAASTEPRELDVVAFGTLSLADKELRGFGLRLDPEPRRDPVLRGKRVVHGTYLPAVEEKIIADGLWGHEVRATLRVVRDALISTSTVRPATFTLIDVQGRHRG